MNYPYFFLNGGEKPAPIFDVQGKACVISLEGEVLETALKLADTRGDFNRWMADLVKNAGCATGIGPYLEDREPLLSLCPQMEADKRYFHLGIDFVLPAGTAIYAPISGVVEESGYEEGDGNYGGYVILRHEFPQTETFYTMFGHLSLSHLPEIGRSVSQSDKIGEVGAQHENGGWNEHTHVQVITEKGKEKGFFFKGYCNAATMPEITELCPDPYPIVAGTILK